jgi:hypothetical protein
MAYAEVADVAVRLGVAEADLDTAQVQALLDDSTALVNGYTGLDWTSQTEVPVAIKWVVINRTLRALNNPDGLRSEQIGSYSYTLATADAGGVGWTQEERRILDSYGNANTARLAGSFAIGYGA